MRASGSVGLANRGGLGARKANNKKQQKGGKTLASYRTSTSVGLTGQQTMRRRFTTCWLVVNKWNDEVRRTNAQRTRSVANRVPLNPAIHAASHPTHTHTRYAGLRGQAPAARSVRRPSSAFEMICPLSPEGLL